MATTQLIHCDYCDKSYLQADDDNSGLYGYCDSCRAQISRDHKREEKERAKRLAAEAVWRKSMSKFDLYERGYSMVGDEGLANAMRVRGIMGQPEPDMADLLGLRVAEK